MLATAVPAELCEAVSGSDELLAELQLIQAMPQARLVPSSVFDRALPLGSVAQKRGVLVKLRCCKKSLDHKCNELDDERACPTHVDAARCLRSKIMKLHGSPECLEKAQQSLVLEREAEKQHQGSAFDALRREGTFDAARHELARAEQRVAAAAVAVTEAQRLHDEAMAALEEVLGVRGEVVGASHYSGE